MDPADSDTLRQALASQGLLVGQHERVLLEVIDNLKGLGASVAQLDIQLKQVSTSLILLAVNPTPPGPPAQPALAPLLREPHIPTPEHYGDDRDYFSIRAPTDATVASGKWCKFTMSVGFTVWCSPRLKSLFQTLSQLLDCEDALESTRESTCTGILREIPIRQKKIRKSKAGDVQCNSLGTAVQLLPYGGHSVNEQNQKKANSRAWRLKRTTAPVFSNSTLLIYTYIILNGTFDQADEQRNERYRLLNYCNGYFKGMINKCRRVQFLPEHDVDRRSQNIKIHSAQTGIHSTKCIQPRERGSHAGMQRSRDISSVDGSWSDGTLMTCQTCDG
ncbi:hypothetical protein F2P81_023705 [Scophthalmus maximus]|uniref:Uncharacterized protein n=1 Tax=Scophthalmus maximus TaxID=52904 RepID=A0A6A4RSC4_SCOMX|nr:hypothetical protein F2P81_023705 [Scophthalmus maximus]